MIFNVYSVYDPEVGSYDTRINLSPLGPEDQAEQVRRSHIKMEEKDKAFMEGKIYVCLGQFDDETGKINQVNVKKIYEFKSLTPKEEGEKEQAKTDA